MYRLNNKSQKDIFAGDTASEALQAWQYANERLADASLGLRFEPVTHRYYIGNVQIPSVSSIVEHFDPFDAEAAAKRCSKNSQHEMFGKSVEEIIAIWNERGRTASSAGTEVHEFGEACFLCKSGRPDDVPAALQNRLMMDGSLEAVTAKEEAMAKWWNDLDIGRYVLIAKESRVYNPDLRYAGTFDLLLYDLQMHHYALKDYKTNANLLRWYGDRLRAPLSPIKADDVGKYTVQQNLYRIELENIGIHIGTMDLIWLREDATYQEVRLQECQNLVAFAARQYKQLKNAA